MERDVRQRATASGATTAPSSRRNEPFATTAAAAVAGENINYLPALAMVVLVSLMVYDQLFETYTHVHLGCPQNCSEGGTCNLDTGRCDCPPFPNGLDNPCARPAHLSHCEYRPGFFVPCGTIHGLRHSCQCLAQCELQNLRFAHPCYDLLTLQKEEKWSGRSVWEMHAAAQAGELPMIDFDTRKPLTEAMLQDLGRWPQPLPAEALTNPNCACHDHGAPLNKECSQCACFLGWEGALCDVRNGERTFCANDCSGNGLCLSGFCKCEEGFFGVDCSLSLGADGAVLTSYERWAMAHPQLRSPPKEQESADSGSLKSSAGNGVVRPRVYVYELPPRFTSHLLYAHHPMEYNSIYSAGRFLHMRLLASEFRTTDPEQADYFFVPVWGRAAGSGPPRYRSKYLIEGHTQQAWFEATRMDSSRPAKSWFLRFQLRTRDYLMHAHPYWNRTNGRDHLWVLTDDHGACDEFGDGTRVKEIAHSIFLTHFGYTGGSTAYKQQTADIHQCYRPNHDIVIPPPVKSTRHKSPTLQALASNQTTLFFFGGDARLPGDPMYPWGGAPGKDGVAEYSHGVRQSVVQLFGNETDFLVYTVNPGSSRASYGSDLAHSQFCLAPSGAGWGIRLVEMMVEGCIPVIVQDNVTQPWEETLPYDRFSLRVKEADLPTLPQVLRAIDEHRIRQMRVELACAWRKMVWSSVHGSLEGEDGHDDAFAMLMYVLRRRLVDREDSDWLQNNTTNDDRLGTACAPLDVDAGAPSRPGWSLCHSTPGPSQCRALPQWHYISLDPSRRTASWPPGGAAAVSRPGWLTPLDEKVVAVDESRQRVGMHRRLGV